MVGYIIYTTIASYESTTASTTASTATSDKDKNTTKRKTHFELCVEDLIYYDDNNSVHIDEDRMYELLHLMEAIEHPNLEDIRLTIFLLTDPTQSDHVRDTAFHWLYTARSLWQHSPRSTMFPWNHGIDLTPFFIEEGEEGEEGSEEADGSQNDVSE